MKLSDSDSLPDSKTQTPRRQTIRPWSALKFRDYRILWASSIAAMMTMSLRVTVTAVWLYEKTDSGWVLAWLGILELVMRIPANLYGGALADEIDRKKLMAATQTASFLLIGVMAILEGFGALQIWHIYLITAVLASTSVLGGPARSALTARVVPRSHLMHAVATNTATMQIGSMVTPAIFFITSLTTDLTLSFGVITVIAAISMVLPMFIGIDGRAESASTGKSRLKNIVEGLKYVKSHPILPGLYLLDVGVTIVSFYRQLFPIFTDQLYKGGRGTTSLLIWANSAGGLVGSLIVMFTRDYKAKGMLVLWATLFYGVLLIFFGATTVLWTGMIVVIFLGATDAVGMTSRQAIVQLTTPDNMRGRASAAHSLAAMSANGLGQAEVGFMSDLVGADKTLYIGGVVSIVVVFLIWWLVKGVRMYRYTEVPSGAAIDDEFGYPSNQYDANEQSERDLRSLK
ncbi:MAG: MFS transporter [Chloroflexi bacterium]|nr:MFS transporter [Chloroflexota bacterium]MDA1281720.1 MFS transporter [Chloroflexota bacterium]